MLATPGDPVLYTRNTRVRVCENEWRWDANDRLDDSPSRNSDPGSRFAISEPYIMSAKTRSASARIGPTFTPLTYSTAQAFSLCSLESSGVK